MSIACRLLILILLVPCLLLAQTAQFTMDNDEGCGSLIVHFTNTSTGSGSLNYFWLFGNGSESYDENPYITYTSSGVYTITLEVTDDNGTSSYTDQVTVHPFPNISFSANDLGGCAPVTTQFTDATVSGNANLVSWSWNFGDGTSSAEQNPSHEYAYAGSYSVILEVVDGIGCENSVTYHNYINVSNPPVVSFTATPPVNCEPINVQFSNSSIGSPPPLSYSWNFGDGGTSSQSNPIHFFQTGIHTVTLLVTDAAGCTNTAQDQVSITQLNPQIQCNPTGCVGEPINFINTEGTASMWDFGDNTGFGYGTYTSHIFESEGIYTIELTAGAGSCATTVTRVINVYPGPDAAFAIDPEVICEPGNITVNNQSAGAIGYDWTIYYENYHDTSIVYESASINAMYNMESEGDYYVSLNAISNLGCRSEVKDTLPVVFSKIDFVSASQQYGCVPFNVSFTSGIITSDPVASYNWLIDGSSFSTNETPPILTFDEVGDYEITLIIETEHGCADEFTIEVHAGEPRHASFNLLEDSVCLGDTLHFENTSSNGNLPVVYLWELYFPNPNYLGNDMAMAPDSVGTFLVTLLAGYNGCYGVAAGQYVNVRGPYLHSLESVFHCENPFQRDFSIQAIDTDVLYWNYGDFSGVDMAGTQVSHTYPEIGSYSINVIAHSEETGCPDYYYNKWVEVTIPEVIASMPDSSCSEVVTLLDSSISINYLNVIWDDVVNNTTGWFHDSIGFASHTYSSGGEKNVMIIGEGIGGCLDTLIKTITISHASPDFSINDTVICLGDTISIANQTNSEFAIVQYQWVFNELDTITAYSDTAFVYVFEEGGGQIAQLSVIDTLSCEYHSVPRVISVNKIDVAVSSEDPYMCIGDTLIVDIEGDISDCILQVDYDDNTAQDDSLIHIYQSTGIYLPIVMLQDSAGCQEFFEVENVSVQQADIQIALSEDTLYCYPETPVFMNPDTIEPYNMSYQWADNVGNTAYVPKPEFVYPERGAYYISVTAETSNECKDSTAFRLIIDGPYADINISDDIVCKNDTVHFWMSNDTNIVSYEWTLGDGFGISNIPAFDHDFNFVPENGKFEIVLTYPAEGCDADADGQDDKYTKIDYINIYPVVADFDLINTETGIVDTNSCSPLPIMFVNNSQGNGNAYEWRINNEEFSNSLLPENYEFINDEILVDTFLVAMYLESQESCKDTAYQEVIVRSVPEVQLSEKQIICLGDEVDLWALGGDSIIWTSGVEITKPNDYNITVEPQESVYVYARIIEKNGCDDTDSVFVFVQQIPEVYSDYSDTTVVVGQEFEINASSNQGGVTYLWSPEVGLSCSDCPNPEVKAEEPIEYTITISDSLACHSVVKRIFIDLFYDYTLDIPNTFTPNNDGENDIVFVKGWGIRDLVEFKVFNRWGEEIFFSNDLNIGWDGTKAGEPQNIDTYAYFVRVKTFNDVELTKKGTITLLR